MACISRLPSVRMKFDNKYRQKIPTHVNLKTFYVSPILRYAWIALKNNLLLLNNISAAHHKVSNGFLIVINNIQDS